MFLVTGYGSIGSLVVDGLIDNNDIVIIDKDEKAIHKALTKFKSRSNVKCIVSDILVKADIARIFLQYPIRQIVHTAAMKHVYFCEDNPLLATLNNVVGINNLLEESLRANVDKFINISTDKSAYPSNVMGATKFIAERNVLLYNSMGRGSYQSIRLGNVLFSTGSLLPTIKDLVGNGLTLGLTNLEATRFFIRPDEIGKFIVDVANNPYQGQILIKKLQSATLKTMVNSMLELIGQSEYKNIKIKGLGQGEKLHEHLFTSAESTHMEDHGAYWSIDYNKTSKPCKVIDSSGFCVSQADFLNILKDLHVHHSP
jgi:UDP-N-acetylglucosamine 4,6-dehydratase/5-epimerase